MSKEQNKCRKCGAPVSGKRPYHAGCRPTMREILEAYDKGSEELKKKYKGLFV